MNLCDLDQWTLNSVLAVHEAMLLRYRQEAKLIEIWKWRGENTNEHLDGLALADMIREKDALAHQLRRLRGYLLKNHPEALTKSTTQVDEKIRREGLRNPWLNTEFLIPPVKE